MISMLTSSAADHGFVSWSCQTDDYRVYIWYLLILR